MYKRGKSIKKHDYNDQAKQEGKDKKKMVKLNTIPEE